MMGTAWHSLSVADAFDELSSTPGGLTSGEAAARLERHGPNRLEPPKPVSKLALFIDQFRSLIVLLLLAASVVAWSLGDFLEAAAIAAVLAVNTLIGFTVELRARRAMESLLSFAVPSATVLRDGGLEEIPSDQLVPGDVIELGEGDNVPADARVTECAELRVNEAPLTGESLPVSKSELAVEDPGTLLADRSSMLFAGTSVYVGRATALVVETGASTQMGWIGTLLTSVEAGKTPLEARLDRLGHRLLWLTLGVAAVVTLLGLLQGAPMGLMIETGIALAIAAAPEGLPAVATIALAVGLRRMALRNALVRRLAAVESLGATTVVCTDKTGTLTSGEMVATTLEDLDGRIEVSGHGFGIEGGFTRDGNPVAANDEPSLMRLLEAAALTTRAARDPETGVVVGDPTDAALTILALKGGVDPQDLLASLPRLHEVPFTSAHRASLSAHSRDGEPWVFVKGAPETILGMCVLDAAVREEMERSNLDLARRGLRVIALASGPGEGESVDALSGLQFLGLVGIMDPPAPGVSDTLDCLREAHIRTVMITGDQRATGEAIARSLGMLEPEQEALDGRDLSGMTDAQLAERVGRVGVFSRVSPEDKLRIVAALQDRGEVVAMIGDGVNDAAALKKSDIGVAMGIRGTDIAKDTAGIVLQDDRFVTIGAAVEQGRVIFENIRKFVFYLFSCNLAEVLVLLFSSIAGLPLPLTALQILWLNLVTDTFPALALAMEPAESDIMTRPPRDPEAAILSSQFLLAMGFYSALITAVTLGSYMYGLRGDAGRATTIAFMTLALAQLFHLGNARSRAPVLTPRRALANRWALGALPLVICLQIVAVHWPPLAAVLGTVPLGSADWMVVVGLAVVPAVVGQLTELLTYRRGRDTRPVAA